MCILTPGMWDSFERVFSFSIMIKQASNNTRQHSLAVTPITSSSHTHLIAVPCANSAIIYGLNNNTDTILPSSFVHLFRSTPKANLVICTGVKFQPRQNNLMPLLAITTVPLTQVDINACHVGLIQITRNPVAPTTLLCRSVANIQLPSNDDGLEPIRNHCIEQSTIMAFHPVHDNVMVVCSRDSSYQSRCVHVSWNSLGESDVDVFASANSPAITACSFAPAGDLLLTSDAQHAVHVWSFDVECNIQPSTQSSNRLSHRTNTNINVSLLHCLAPYSSASGRISVIEWLIDTMGREHVIAGHTRGNISVWSGAEPHQHGDILEEQDGDEDGVQEDDVVMYGTLTEYPSLNKSSAAAAIQFLHRGEKNSWWATSENGTVFRLPLQDRKHVESAAIPMITAPQAPQASVLMTPTATKTRTTSSRMPRTRTRTRTRTTPVGLSGSKTPMTVKVHKKVPKHVPFGRSSPTMRDVHADEATKIFANITSHRFSSSLSAKHSRMKRVLHHPPPYPLPTMLDVLETTPIELLQPSFGMTLRGIASLGGSGIDSSNEHRYVLLTEIGLRVATIDPQNQNAEAEKMEVLEGAVVEEGNDRNGSDAIMTTAAAEFQQRSSPVAAPNVVQNWQKHSTGSVHRRFRLPPAAAHKNVATTTGGHNRIEMLNSRVYQLESDLRQVRNSFKAFTREMQQDLHRALNIVSKIVETRPPRFNY